MSLKHSIEKQWYGKPTWLLALAPLSAVFSVLSLRRKKQLQAKAYKASCPVIVVGNIAVGGTGKTPVILALIQLLKDSEFRPGVVMRGYGAKLPDTIKSPVLVPPDADANTFGDEPVLIASHAECPVWIAKDRVSAVKAAEQYGCNVILSDDGLQHYAMARSFELVVQDSQRGIGNGWCFPVGPLRESPERLSTVDFVLNNHSSRSLKEVAHDDSAMVLQPAAWVNVKKGTRVPVDALPWRGETGANQRVVAVAGIGNPKRFFNTLEQMGVFFEAQSFDDHHRYSSEDFALVNGRPVVMTAKDAVKCRALAEANWWYLEVEAILPEALTVRILSHCINYSAQAE